MRIYTREHVSIFLSRHLLSARRALFARPQQRAAAYKKWFTRRASLAKNSLGAAAEGRAPARHTHTKHFPSATCTRWTNSRAHRSREDVRGVRKQHSLSVINAKMRVCSLSAVVSFAPGHSLFLLNREELHFNELCTHFPGVWFTTKVHFIRTLVGVI